MNYKLKKKAGVPPMSRKGPDPYRDPVQLFPRLPAGVRKAAGMPKPPDLLKRPKVR